MTHALSISCFLVGVLLSACGAEPSAEPDTHERAGGAQEPEESAESEAYGSWMKRPHAEWPRIAVVNQIDYVDQHHPVAGCGLLLEVGGEVLAATAKHVLTYFKSPEMDSVDFEGTLKRWTMYPKDSPSDVVVVDALLNRDSSESLEGIPCDKDWLLFSVRERSHEIQPLRFRTTPLEKGEPVYVVGWRYTETDRSQIVYEGVFVRYEPEAIAITAEKLIDNTVGGLSGAPVIDESGYLVGIMSRGTGEIQRLSPIEYPRDFLRSRAEGK